MACSTVGQRLSAQTGPIRNACTCGRVHKVSRDADVFGVRKLSARERKAAARAAFENNWRLVEPTAQAAERR